MRRPVRPIAMVLVTGVLAATAPAAHAALETVLQDDANLIHRPTDQVTTSMRRLAALGVDRVRLTANWSVLTRDADATTRPAFDARDPAAYEQARWRGLDQAVHLARSQGLQVLIDIGFWAPRWATTSGPGPRARANVNPDDFADFAVAVARRYSGRFTPAPDPAAAPPPPSSDQNLLEALLGGPAPVVAPPPAPGPLDRVDEFALWNEPNHPGLLLPQWSGRGRQARPVSPALYGRMLRAAYAAAKETRPDAAFLAGNTASMGTDGYGAVAPLRFIRALACVDRRLRPLRGGDCASFTEVPGDGWAHHPYNRNRRPDTRSPASRPDDATIGDLDRLSLLLRRLVARHRIAPALQRIHLTEFGFETQAIGNRPRVAPATQARWLTWAEYLASRVPGVVSFAQFLLRDQPPAPVRVSDSPSRPFGQYYTGLLTVDGADKPAAESFVAGLFAQRRSRGRTLLWVRLRLGPGTKAVDVERRLPRADWAPLLHIEGDGREAFTRYVRTVPGARYRLRHPGPGGALVVGESVAPVAPTAPARRTHRPKRPAKRAAPPRRGGRHARPTTGARS